MIRIFIGYDAEETVAYHVLSHSIMERASEPASMTPVTRSHLPMFTRTRGEHDSTDFSISRFLVPYLCGFEGRAIFMDCDMLCRTDIAELWHETNTLSHSVHVVKHEYDPVLQNKFLDQPQTSYYRKNWSSLMVFNNARCLALSLNYVNTAPGLALHQFQWLNDHEIGEINPDWNHLVGEYAPHPKAKLVHFTRGTPCFKAFSRCEFSDEWYQCQDRLLHYNRVGEYSKEAAA